MPRRVRITVNKDSLLSQMAGLSIGERTSDDERSALENLPDVLFNRIVQHFHDPQDFFSLAATKYSFKFVMHQTRAILAFGLLNMTHADREANGKKFYRRAAAQGSIEGMIVHSDFLFADAQSDGDFAAVEQLLRSVLAREADEGLRAGMGQGKRRG